MSRHATESGQATTSRLVSDAHPCASVTTPEQTIRETKSRPHGHRAWSRQGIPDAVSAVSLTLARLENEEGQGQIQEMWVEQTPCRLAAAASREGSPRAD